MDNEYPGNDAIAESIQSVATMTRELLMRLERLASSLGPDSEHVQFDYAQEYATWHAEELLQDMGKRAASIQVLCDAIAGYTLTGRKR